MLNSIEDIIDLHENKGNIEDAYIDMHFDEKILKEIMKEMVDVDSSINRELSFWSFIFEEIEELRE